MAKPNLAGNAPVRARRDHVADSFFAPRRIPVHLLDRIERPLAEVVMLHADEPLRRRPEDERRLVAPAMRVTVTIGRVGEQAAALAEQIDDDGFASNTFCPATCSVPSRKRPSPATGLSTGRPYFWPTWKSSMP